MTDTPSKNRLMPLRQYVVVALVLASGAILSTVLFFIAREFAEHREREHFELIADQQIDDVKTMITGQSEFIFSIRSFYDASNKVDQKKFRAFVNSALARHASIWAAGWIPRVPYSQRKAFEESARQEGLIDFQITEQNIQLKLVRAERRNEYFPVYYIEPSVVNERIIGFDIASDPSLMKTLLRALDGPLVLATKSLQSVQFPTKDAGLLIAMPIFDKGKPMMTPKERRTNLRGFALAVFDMGHLIKDALANSSKHLNELLITDVTDTLEAAPLYHFRTDGQLLANSNREALRGNKTKLQFGKPVHVANRKWNLKIIAGPGLFTRSGHGEEWLTLTVGLLFTGLLSFYLLAVMRRNEWAERLVSQRTVELLASQKALEREIAERKQIEQNLAAFNRQLEQRVVERTMSLEQRARELAQANSELERFNDAAVGRELKMIDLKRQVNELLQDARRPPAYDLSVIEEKETELESVKVKETNGNPKTS